MRARVVVVGCGYWGKNWYNTLTSRVDCTVVAVIDPKPSIPVQNQFKNLEEFDNSGCEYDYAIISVQAEYHREYVQYFKSKILSSHILVEKPCGVLSEPREYYYDCYPGFIFLSSPQYKLIKSMLEEKQLGKILYSQFTRASMGPRIRTDVSIVEDYMIHDLYMYADLFGRITERINIQKSILSHLETPIKPATAFVQLYNPDTQHTSTFFSSWLYPVKERRMVIVGTEGSLIWKEDEVLFTRSHYAADRGFDKYNNPKYSLLEYPVIHISPQTEKSNLDLQFEDFINQEPRAEIQKDLTTLLYLLK